MAQCGLVCVSLCLEEPGKEALPAGSPDPLGKISWTPQPEPGRAQGRGQMGISDSEVKLLAKGRGCVPIPPS